MSILTEQDIKGDLTVFTVTGELTSHEILEGFTDFYGGKTTKNVLIDLGEVTMKSVSMSDVSYLANFARRFDSDREGGKSGIVAKTGWALEVAKSFKELSNTDKTPFQVEVFPDKKRAMEWIEGK